MPISQQASEKPLKPKLLNADDGLVELVEQLEAIDENKAAAKLNEVSMADSMGRRIYY